ncbi:MAG TPA: DUF4389 domain-containing protein [Gammaproteobacteria bacterium]
MNEPPPPHPDPSSNPNGDTPAAGGGAPLWEEPTPTGGETAREREPRPRHPLEQHLTNKSTWLRLVFVVVFAAIWWITELVLTAVVVLQCLWALFSGQPNERLRGFGQSLARYAYQIFRYMTFNTDERPFPFDLDWPSSGPDATSG